MKKTSLVCKVSKQELSTIVAHAKDLLKRRDAMKWEICRYALKVCFISDRKAGNYRGKYSITNFATDIGMNRKTLSCWILEYRIVASKLHINKDILNFTETKRLNSAITKVKIEQLKRYKEDAFYSHDNMDKEVEKYLKEDVLVARLKASIKLLKHHIFTFTKSKFKTHHKDLLAEYGKELSKLNLAYKNVKVGKSAK